MSLIEANYGLMKAESSTEFVHHIALFAALLCACIVIGHLLEESRWMNESITALAIGLGTGCVILLTSGGTSSHILEFKQEFFFIYLLPPIIFNAGFVSFRIELITVFVPVVCQKSLFQSISLKIAISLPVVSLS
ncbi:putative cation/H+ exchanger, CPA1 family [Helianthus annuus]|nr:putative cation/H+ exchanger, CPA1 family [Helianthus annuus]